MRTILLFVKSLTLDRISAREAGRLTGLFLRRCKRTPDAEAYRAYDPEAVRWRSYIWRDFATSLGVDPGDPRSLVEPVVSSAVLTRIGAGLAAFPAHALVRRVWLTPEPWTIDGELITPTLKIKRQQLETRFAREIEQLYQPLPVTRSPG